MDEAIVKGYILWEKFQSGDITSFNFSDIIWLLGIAVIVFLIIKISFKFLKVILILAAVALFIGFLITSGIITL